MKSTTFQFLVFSFDVLKMFKKIKQSQRYINHVQALVALKSHIFLTSCRMEILFKKVVGLVNYYVLVNCYALGPTGQYSVLIFCIPTVFDVIPLELVRFQNYRYSISSCSFAYPALPLSLLFSYSNVEVKKVERFSDRFRPFSSLVEMSSSQAEPQMLFSYYYNGIAVICFQNLGQFENFHSIPCEQL